MTKEVAINASTQELNTRLRELSTILDTVMGDEWDTAYDEYCMINVIVDDRYRTENIEKFEAYFKEHIEGKTWEEVDKECFEWYSDWHKDMFGYRPRTLCKDW